MCGMIMERYLAEDESGIYRSYYVSSAESSGFRHEIELRLWQRSLRT